MDKLIDEASKEQLVNDFKVVVADAEALLSKNHLECDAIANDIESRLR
jgi:hypothetical protein